MHFRRAGGIGPLVASWRAEGISPVFRPACRVIFWFAVAALLALPIFAHGCHGDDVDHEPLLIPFRFNSEEP